MEFVVRRRWVDKNLPQHLQKWQQASTPTTRLSLAQRHKRLEAWRRERAPTAGADDRIIPWIDRELARQGPAGDPEPSPLLKVRVSRADVRGLDRRPAPQERLLRLAWLGNLPDPESMSVNELKNALESRGYDVDRARRNRRLRLTGCFRSHPNQSAPGWPAGPPPNSQSTRTCVSAIPGHRDA